MSYIKNQAQIVHIRNSCKIASAIMAELVAAVKEGITTEQINEIAEQLALQNKVKPSFKGYLKYPFATCISVNDEVVHGLPSKKKLINGDVVGIDLGINYRGYYSDLTRTVIVKSGTSEANKLVAVTKEALRKGIEQIKPNNCTGDIGAAIQGYVEDNGFYVVRELVGHGVGTAVHEPPSIPNYGKAGKGEPLVAGMVLAIEPMVNTKSGGVRIMPDGWTFKTKKGGLSAHFEDTVLVTERGHEVLT